MAQIDAPLLGRLDITFSYQLIFNTPQTTQFISRTPKFKARAAEAHMSFSNWQVQVVLSRGSFDRMLEFAISCRKSDWQLSFLAQVHNSLNCLVSFFPQALIPAVEFLYIETGFPGLNWQDDVENSQWLEVLQSFTGVKELNVSLEFGPYIVPVLKKLVEEGSTEVLLPALRILFLEEPLPSGPVKEIIEQFVAARQLADHPITLSIWNSKFFVVRSA